MSTHDVSLTGVPHIGRATVIGALIGALSIAVPVDAFLLYLSGDVKTILTGMHVAFFAGMGYGGMLGAVIQADRHQRAQGADHDRDITGKREPARPLGAAVVGRRVGESVEVRAPGGAPRFVIEGVR